MNCLYAAPKTCQLFKCRWFCPLWKIFCGRPCVLPREDGVLPGEDGVLPGEDSVLPGEDGVLSGADGVLPGEDGVLDARRVFDGLTAQ